MRPLFYAGLMVFAAGCSCGGNVAIDDFPTTAAKAYCKKIYSCCTSAEVTERSSSIAPDQVKCESTMGAAFGFQRDAIKEGEAKGRVVYHGDRLGECLARLDTATCDSLKSNATDIRPSCDAYLEAKVAAGGACANDAECIGGECVGASDTADGACVAFVAANADCTMAPCGSGLYCTGNPRTCQPKKADGQECSNNGECSTGGCNGRMPDAGVPGSCGPMGGVGTTCFVTDGCSAAGGVPLLALAALVLRRMRRRANQHPHSS